MKNKLLGIIVGPVFILILVCACAEKKENGVDKESVEAINFAAHVERIRQNQEVPDLFQVHVTEEALNFQIPAIQSASVANYQGNWILIGGRKEGLHSMDRDPPAFPKLMANDSIWVIDLQNGTSKGVPLPLAFAKNLSATSQQYYQVNEKLYLAGGFTVKDTATVNDWTSDLFFEIDIPSLIGYVNANGASPPLDQVFTKVIQSPYVQVTGGEMMVVNNHFYLIGGQKYTGAYLPGNTGEYTNAIRKFDLTNGSGSWQLSDTLTILDKAHLHRRDFNMTETVMYDAIDSVGAVIYGGVFTDNDLAFRNPVYINGLVSGNPTFEVDTTFYQKTNLYTGAKVQAAMLINNQGLLFNHTTFLGGISYEGFNATSDSLIVPPPGRELPFSNIISSFLTDGEFYSVEKVQFAPNAILPTYLGTNATFFALPGFELNGHPELLDLNKIFANADLNTPVLIGYLYGGISSREPNTVTPNGNYGTSVNKKLYQVFMTMQLPTAD